MTPRLLLVDDHQLLRQGLRRAVEEAGFDVVAEAGDGEEAVRLAEKLHPDLVLMDVSMPVLDGIEATRLLRSRVPEARVVILTMHGEEEGFLVKDCTMQEVTETLRLAAGEDAVVSPGLARSMLVELPGPETTPRGAEPVLSRREEEVLQLFADGCATTEVASRLFISA